MAKIINMNDYFKEKSNTELEEYIDSQDLSNQEVVKDIIKLIFVWIKDVNECNLKTGSILNSVIEELKTLNDRINVNTQSIESWSRVTQAQSELLEIRGELISKMNNTIGLLVDKIS